MTLVEPDCQLTNEQIAWPLIANFSCPEGVASGTCTRSENMGWRYLLFTLGGCTLLLWAFRFFVFKLEESPRFLVGRGHDAEAVAVIHRLAAYNGRTCSLTVEDLARVGDGSKGTEEPRSPKLTVLSRSSDYTTQHVKALFKTRRLAWSTSLLISLWGTCFHTLSFFR